MIEYVGLAVGILSLALTVGLAALNARFRSLCRRALHRSWQFLANEIEEIPGTLCLRGSRGLVFYLCLLLWLSCLTIARVNESRRHAAEAQRSHRSLGGLREKHEAVVAEYEALRKLNALGIVRQQKTGRDTATPAKSKPAEPETQPDL